jgi:hypothetical protein
MVADKKSFKALLEEAPIATDTVSLVGTVSRSHEPDKFVIILGDGRSVTLETDAVKDYTVMGGAIGQLVVKIEIDSTRVPRDAQSISTEFKRPTLETIYWYDHPKNPISDTHPGQFPDVTIPQADVAGPVPVGPGGDPWGGFGAGQLYAPFALATPHQVADAQIAAIQAAYPYFRRGLTLPWPIGWGGNDPILHTVMAPG